MYDREKPYRQWLDDMQRFQTGPWGWLLIVLTVLIIGPLVALGLTIFPQGHYPRFILLLPGFTMGAAFFFGLGPLFHRLDQRKTTRTQAPTTAPAPPTPAAAQATAPAPPTPAPREWCGTNDAFTHGILPTLAFKDPMPFVSMSSFPQDATARIRQVWDIVVRDLGAARPAADAPDVGPRWDTVFVAARPCGVITLPPPEREGEAYFIALLFNLRARNGELAIEQPFVSYFVLERPPVHPDGATQGTAVLIRQHEDGRRERLRSGLAPDRDSFLRTVDEESTGRLGPSFLKPEDLQKLVAEK